MGTSRDLLLANSRLSWRLPSVSSCAAQLVGLVLGWCRGRCRTFLEYGPLAPIAALLAYRAGDGSRTRQSAWEWKLCLRGRTEDTVRIIPIGPWLSVRDRSLIVRRRVGQP